MGRAATAGRAAESNTGHPANPGAEWLPLRQLERTVRDFYGTRTLMFDREFAEALLALNTGNRRINRRKVGQLAAQMALGQFENTGEPIIVSREGILNNGQHRLLAVIEADAIVDMDVRFGIPRRVFTKTDTGAPRSAADVLTIGGIAQGTRVSSALRLLVLYDRGLPDAIRDFVSNDEINTALSRWPSIAQVSDRLLAYAFPKPVRSTPLLSVAYLASRSPGREKLDRWLHVLATGLDAKRDDPAYQLRERLVRGIEAAIGTREGQLERFALMIKSWNLHQSGRTAPARELRWKVDGRKPEPFPQVEGADLGPE